ncbi:hypothetical protein [Streptomyces acidiscabies]|uniref:Large membrane protein n=1 Tax=Streptomyces acidiscabies TaxID=42234 RepID=A0AAP6BLB9_9ACTN|nr:hypothetical protein [Streptomyces acidiscabies]MDX2966607.1 hypothetical protein [Streptomyces acidiscabies]MDX3019931.1 hypothetical protein [Streptomyces acidiscabies]MDX3796577.1 hypothetical protein [Streptomyces acidiscabies]GAV42495.1 hypothetical protein Saa2_05426 [Streptomyces acidiscabies]
MTTQVIHPRPPDPGHQPPQAPRAHARTKATRLLSAGTYLDVGYRRAVIRELLRYYPRVVAPSYGYDAVSVLAHALAARRLHRLQWAVGLGSAVVIWWLLVQGTLSGLTAVLFLVWVVWGAAYLRRIATLHILMTRLKETRPDGGFDGAYPANRALTDAVVHKIDQEQSSSSGIVFYGGFRPFVGAGELMREWSNAQLLLGARKKEIDTRKGGGATVDLAARETPVPFTVREITDYVATRMRAELREEAREDERIEGLTVEQRRFTTAIRTNDRTRGPGWSQLPGRDDLPGIRWREDYDSAREYLCVRVGSWNEELVTSIFVGFDLKGDTLHTEFYTYVLGPLVGDFHLADRLPDTFDGRLAVRVAWGMVKAVPMRALVLPLWPLYLVPQRFLPAAVRRLLRPGRSRASVAGAEVKLVSVDNSEFQLGRYVTKAVDCGALTSVREMATSDVYHHFFQKTDAIKYMQIVQRRTLQNIRAFLAEKKVDLAEHDRAQTNILMGDKNQVITGDNNRDFGYEYHEAGGGPSGSSGDRGGQ